ncbi:hypothetical protein IVA87_04325 [Bradyrhizobium sp. 147]|nr:hypothetical protein [Bradyrhizobium sp. 147]
MRDAQCCVMVKTAPTPPLEVAKADLLFEFVGSRAQCASAAWQYRRADEIQCWPQALKTNIWLVLLRPLATRSAAIPLVGFPRASNLDVPDGRARGQNAKTTALPHPHAT